MSQEFLPEIITYLYNQCHRNLITGWGKPSIDKSGKQILDFPKAETGIYLQQTITVTNNYPHYLELGWWAQFLRVKINQKIAQEGDLFDQKCRLLLALNTNQIEIFLDAPHHDRGALVTSILSVENAYYAIWQDVAVMSIYGADISSLELEQLWSDLEQWYNYDRQLFTLQNLQQRLRIIGKPLVKNKHIYLLGNAHIDIAWLWTISETKAVMERTCRSVIDLQNKFPELVFNQSSAVTYKWIEEANPQLFQQIQEAVKNHRWELTGGSWVEPDCNLPAGEALIRQIIYGKSYFLEKFNVDIKTAWLPDSFGFNWQLPQILLKSGLQFFVTQKLSWNDTNAFPYSYFWWQGVDGSRIFTYFTNLIGAGINPLEIAKHLHKLETTEQITDSIWLYGVGDHGGGPTASMLNLARQLEDHPLAPHIHHGTIESFLENLLGIDRHFPVWQDELYLEFHRGTYTTKADQKSKNRRSELLLLNLEKLCSIHNLLNNKTYPQNLLDRGWQLLLVNQFHDIITGTSIPEVFACADHYWAEIDTISQEILGDFSVNSGYLWNLYSWETEQLVSIPLDKFQHSLLSGITVNDEPVYYEVVDRQVIFLVTMPPCSSSIVKFLNEENNAHLSHPNLPSLNLEDSLNTLILSNTHLSIYINKATGEISQVYDFRAGASLLSNPIHWQFFVDRGQYWDAWNIDPDYQKHGLGKSQLLHLEVVHHGQLVIRVQTIHQFHQSTITSTIQLDCHSPSITIFHHINWQEEYTLAKIAFPLNFTPKFTTYEIPMATIDRPFQDYKWEVPAQFWASVSSSDSNLGLAILNDSKYGYDSQPNQLRLTVLRSPQWPCPDSDRGDHYFSYRLVPHSGNWRSAGVVKMAQEFNNPLFITSKIPVVIDNLVNVSSPQIVFSSWYRSQDQQGWILRFYESWGMATETAIHFHPQLRIQQVQECNLMGEILSSVDYQNNRLLCQFQPYEIKSFFCLETV